jgi:hypothetical protein
VVTIVVVMALILVLAGLVVVYVAYPHRGEEMPGAAWLGEAMAKAAEAAPTLDAEADVVGGGVLDDHRSHRAS